METYTVNPECNVILREFSSGKCKWRVAEENPMLFPCHLPLALATPLRHSAAAGPRWVVYGTNRQKPYQSAKTRSTGLARDGSRFLDSGRTKPRKPTGLAYASYVAGTVWYNRRDLSDATHPLAQAGIDQKPSAVCRDFKGEWVVKIAVVGGGISGMLVARMLADDHAPSRRRYVDAGR